MKTDDELAVIAKDTYDNTVVQAWHNVVARLRQEFGDNVPLPPPDDPPIPQPGNFKLFEIITRAGEPDLEKQFGFKTMEIFYVGGIFGRKPPIGDHALPSKEAVQATAKSLRPGECGLIDIEHWRKNKDTFELTPQGIRNYVQVMKWAQETKHPAARIGLYSMIPEREYFDVLEGGERLKSWQRRNDAALEIVKHVDFIAASCYAFNDLASAPWRRQDWVKYGTGQIVEGHRMVKAAGVDIPVYGVLWPTLHQTNKDASPSFWRLQLETMKDAGADGLIIWADIAKRRKEPFSELVWWPTTVDFVNSFT